MASKISTKAWCYRRCGPISKVLALETIELKAAKESTIVKVMRAPIHRTDSAVINGTALGRSKKTLKKGVLVGGCEGVGKVVSAGHGNKKFKEGDLVWVGPLQGSWAETIVVNPEQCHKIDPKHAELATYASCLLGAQQLISGYAPLKAGDAIVQNGGSSLTSLAVSALAEEQKIPVFTAAQKGKRFADAAKRHSAFQAKTVEYTAAGRREIAKWVLDEKLNVKIFLNGVGGTNYNEFSKLIGKRGTIVNYGAQSGYGLMWASSHLIYQGATVTGMYLPAVLNDKTYQERQTQLDFVLSTLAKKKFAYPTEVVALDKFPATWDSLYVKGGGIKGVVTN